jgi:hypothetical protein
LDTCVSSLVDRTDLSKDLLIADTGPYEAQKLWWAICEDPIAAMRMPAVTRLGDVTV